MLNSNETHSEYTNVKNDLLKESTMDKKVQDRLVKFFGNTEKEYIVVTNAPKAVINKTVILLRVSIPETYDIYVLRNILQNMGYRFDINFNEIEMFSL